MSYYTMAFFLPLLAPLMNTLTGKTDSVTESNIVNKVVSDMLIDISNQCASQTGVSQTITFSGIHCGGDVTFQNITNTIDLKSNFTCASAQNIDSALLNDFKNKLDQTAQAQAGGMGKASSANISNLTTEISNNLDIKQLSTCLSSNLTEQAIQTSDVLCGGNFTAKDISNKLTLEVANKCINQQKTVANLSSQLDAQVKQEASAKTSMIGSLSSSSSCMIILIIMLIAYMSLQQNRIF